MKGILDTDVSYRFTAANYVPQEGDQGGEVLMSDKGPMYFMGESIYLGRNDKWIKIEVSDIKLVMSDLEGCLSLIMKYTLEGSDMLEITLDSTNRSHLTALRYVLMLYGGILDTSGDISG